MLATDLRILPRSSGGKGARSRSARASRGCFVEVEFFCLFSISIFVVVSVAVVHLKPLANALSLHLSLSDTVSTQKSSKSPLSYPLTVLSRARHPRASP